MQPFAKHSIIYVYAAAFGLSPALIGPPQGAAPKSAARQSAERKDDIARITMQDVHGKSVRPFVRKNRAATLLIFIAHDCPISNTYAREVGRICKEYEKRGVAAYVVYADKDLKREDALKHSKEFGYPCPALLDRQSRLVRLTGARMTPEAVLLEPDGKVVYRGRIDDTYINYGRRRDEPRTRDLRRAIDAFLAGKPVSPNRTPVIGCYIPDVPS